MHQRTIDHALAMCESLAHPDASKGEGEVGFWFEVERSDTSAKLWSDRGLNAIEERLKLATSERDRNCLLRLRKEAILRKLVRDDEPLD